jgi:hypothetical protein
MLFNNAILERVLASEGCLPPADFATLELFSDIIEGSILNIVRRATDNSAHDGSSPELSEESLLKDIGCSSPRKSVKLLTHERVNQVLG